MIFIKHIFLVAVLTFNIFAQETLPYDVQVYVDTETPPRIHVSFKTFQVHPRMCFRTPVSISMEKPVEKDTGVLNYTTRLISEETDCLKTPGVHTGCMSLALGPQLPMASDGIYSLTIDNIHYGYVQILKGQAVLLKELP